MRHERGRSVSDQTMESLMITVHTMGFIEKKKVPGTTQENGVSERMNKTIMEHAKSMRLHDGLPLQF
jgi:hypothetical protein